MRKPSFSLFYQLKKQFDLLNQKYGQQQQIVPYFISSHPGCQLEDMAELAAITRDLNFKLEQVQDFTPTPMTLATTIYYTGYHPYSLKKLPSPQTDIEKKQQNLFFFWYKPEVREKIIWMLRKMNRTDLIRKIFNK